jgi:hypothetical protein
VTSRTPMIHTEKFDETITGRASGKTLQSTKMPEALLTRKELAGYITNDLGRPMSFSTLTKLCALGEGPPVFEFWGRFPLYRRQDGKAWADARARKVPSAGGCFAGLQESGPNDKTAALQENAGT